ncbi:hypothetical protein RYX36_011447 [Vicia faba]
MAGKLTSERAAFASSLLIVPTGIDLIYQTILTLFPHSPPLPPPEEREQFPEIQQEPNHQLPEHPGDQAPQKPGPSPQQSKTSPSISSSSWPFTSSDCYFIRNFLNDEVGPSHITPREGGEAGP